MDTTKAQMFYSVFSEFILQQEKYFNLKPNGWKIIAHSLPVLPSFQNAISKKYFPITLSYCVSDNRALTCEILIAVERFIINIDNPKGELWKELSQERIDLLYREASGKYIYCYYDNFILNENSKEWKLEEVIFNP